MPEKLKSLAFPPQNLHKNSNNVTNIGNFVTTMRPNTVHLFTAQEAENLLGSKYFYRQRIYRLAEQKKIVEFNLRGKTCYLGNHIVRAFMIELEEKIKSRFPEISQSSIQVYYDTVSEKRVVVDGIFGKSISVNTEKETEEDLLTKLQHIIEWFGSKPDDDEPLEVDESVTYPKPALPAEANQDSELGESILPEEILWVKTQDSVVDGVQVKSQILISLASIADFIGIRSDQLTRWLSSTSFADSVLSVHPKKIDAPQNSGAWKKSISPGFSTFLPFELVPEVIVSFRQTKWALAYPEKAQILYDISQKTLQSVGLALSGNQLNAADELAKVGAELGIPAADQIIAVFKQYETRDFQIMTTKQFNSKVKKLGYDYAATIGTMTFGITGRLPGNWKALGVARNLPAKLRASSREVMRQVSPEDGVGMTFGEKHFLKDANVDEAIETGKQAKGFYVRLKNVGLLDKPT